MKKLIETLLIGKCDTNKIPKGKQAQADYLAPYHLDMAGNPNGKINFKDERTDRWGWRPFRAVAETTVQDLQRFLQKAGFLPDATIDGVYGYRTQAAVRLFQEYVRTVEGKTDIGEPDGKVGKNTFKYITEWQQKEAENFVCDWGKPLGEANSDDYNHWIALLEKGKNFYLNNANKILDQTENFNKPSDTQRIENWNTSSNAIHLIGIRRGQEHWFDASAKNKDLFVLLVKGLVFYFWGSTVSDPGRNKLPPFLAEGQHLYRFSWHKRMEKVSGKWVFTDKIYQALRPKTTGVLVFRCKDGQTHIDEDDVIVDPNSPNNTINIHWSGLGSSNFSAGCQVIAGASYINHQEKLIDCRAFAGRRYADLGKKNGLNKVQSRGAYNVLADLILCYTPKEQNTVYYTLARESTAFLSEKITTDIIAEMENKMKAVIK